MARTGKRIENMGREELFRTFADSFEKVAGNFNFLVDLFDRLIDLKEEYTKNKNNK